MPCCRWSETSTSTRLGSDQEILRKYSPQSAPPVPDVAEPEQKTERRKVIEDAFAQAPRLDIVYKIPAGNTPDWYALSVLGEVLSGGIRRVGIKNW